jgi:alkaline phosphatase D
MNNLLYYSPSPHCLVYHASHFYSHSMKLLAFFAFALLVPISMSAQLSVSSDSLPPSLWVHHHQHASATVNDSMSLDPALAPFYHGVASGDPSSSSVFLWTRVTSDTNLLTPIAVDWRMAADTGMVDIVAEGTTITDANRDYTVKVEATGLEPDRFYYYEFSALGRHSLRGRTKTTPEGPVSNLRFAVVSCNNYEDGYFSAYGRIADRNDIDAVIHLGDYIYEGTDQPTDPDNPRDRVNEEAISLSQYRARYSLYRLDPDLRRAHQQHPFITIWDDHETSNDAWQNGAQAHDPQTDGNWTLRKSVAKQVYFEWLPIRPSADTSIYRVLHYGDLADLIMLDTRLEAREQQIYDVTDPALYDSARTMMGKPQRDWMIDALAQSQAHWKLIGNQVVFSPFHIGFAAGLPGNNQTFEEVESTFLDIWDGYPAERRYLIEQLDSLGLSNLVWLSGDFHSSFAMEVADPVNDPDSSYQPVPTYDRSTGRGAIGVEFVTPSISSRNFDERIGSNATALLETFMTSPLPTYIPNPHMKFVDLDNHGYVLLDLKADTIQANWFFVPDVTQPSQSETFRRGMYNTTDSAFLRGAGFPSRISADRELPSPAPAQPRHSSDSLPNVSVLDSAPVLLRVYPNPVDDFLALQVAQRSPQPLQVELLDMQGRRQRQLMDGPQPAGVFDLRMSVRSLPAGTYLLRITGSNRYRQTYQVKVLH